MDKTKFVERPWGRYCMIFQEPGVWVKKVVIDTGQRLSLQKHLKRTENWVLVIGEGIVTLGNEEIKVKKSSVINIPLGALHRIKNNGISELVFIEVAYGDYLAEDDIIRLDDDYSRV